MAFSFAMARPPAILLVAFGLVPTGALAQGFGIFKKTVTLSRSLPPVIDLSGARVAVTVTAVPGPAQRVTPLFRAKLMALIFSDTSLIDSATNAERIIEVTITDFTSATKIDPQDRSRVVTATLRAAYRAINAQTKQSLDAKNVAFDYERRFPAATAQPATKTNGGVLGTIGKIGSTIGKPNPANASEQPPTAEQLNTLLVESLAVQVAQRIVLTKETLAVPLPRGKLDKASDLGVAGRWGAMLEEFEQTPALPAGDDAYRIYGIGVANEALAYLESDPAKQRDLVANAAQNFKGALKLRSDDSTLQKAENRIADSQATLALAAQRGRPAAPPAAGAPRSGPAADAKGKATRWDNAAVVELAKAGFKDAELIDAIKVAPSPAFDVASPGGLLELRRAGISDAVVRAMRQRMEAAAKDQ